MKHKNQRGQPVPARVRFLTQRRKGAKNFISIVSWRLGVKSVCGLRIYQNETPHVVSYGFGSATVLVADKGSVLTL
jgi:hypothetical protein